MVARTGDIDAGLPEVPHRAWSLLTVTLLTVLGVCMLLALGVWQVERRAWKLDLIHRVDTRIHAAPVAPPGPADWPFVNAANSEYLHVRVRGHFLNSRETPVEAVTEKGGGFWVLTPFVTDRGFTVLVNRGFVPEADRDPKSRAAGQRDGETVVTGLLRLTEPGGAFLRHNDPGAGRWYSRDVAAIAAARGLVDAAPYFIDADATPNPGGLPVGGLTVVNFPNSHLIYAITWFTLAAMLAVTAGRSLRAGWREWLRTRRAA